MYRTNRSGRNRRGLRARQTDMAELHRLRRIRTAAARWLAKVTPPADEPTKDDDRAEDQP